MSRKLPLAEGESARTACAPAVLRGGVDERTGEVLTARVVTERVSWCADLVAGMQRGVLEEHFNAADVRLLASGVGMGGEGLPSKAWMALRRLGWAVSVPEGVRVNDRIVRMAQEQAGRLLRSVVWRADLTDAVLKTWPVNPLKRTAREWEAVRAAVEGGEHLPASVIRSRTRQIAAFLNAHDRLPSDLFGLEDVPRVARMLVLAAVDRQQATLERLAHDPSRAVLRLQLPTRPDPRGYGDWTWVACPLSLPPTVPGNAVLHLPTLRPTGTGGGRVRADLAYTHAVPRPARTGHTVALGVDWGLNTLLSAGAVRLHDDGRMTALGSGGQYRAAGVMAKQHRLRRHGEHLHAKTSHLERVLDGRPDHHRPDGVRAKRGVLAEESRRVAARRSNLNDALAWSAARWAVDQAIAAHTTVIYLEDLRSMEAKGMGRTVNTRLSQQVRGQITERMRHLAAEAGIAVVTVPAPGTSRLCPCCLTPLRHRKAPDRPTTPGWKWALCPNTACGWQGDRDHGAWRRIAARGLAHQSKTVTDRTTGHTVIRTVVDRHEQRAVLTPITGMTTAQAEVCRKDRSKSGPTRHRTTSRPAPRRRGAPSPAPTPTGGTGQRPEGHVSTDRQVLPRAARRRHQDVSTISTPITRRHRPRGAAVGAGFHLHAHASPPRWETIPEPTSGIGSLS